MSLKDMTGTTVPEDSQEKIRGRIPRPLWGYVRGQYELAERTYEEIGNEFNCTPSAVFYVVRRARESDIPATLERPADMPETETTRSSPSARTSQRPRELHQDAHANPPSQMELMAQQANAWLTNETCKRLFDATSNTIVSFVGFEGEPSETSKKMAKDAIHEVRRALASLELKIEMMPLHTPAPPPRPAETTEPASAA